ncbi:Pre-mRNA-processing factor 19 [Entomortierella chlamydospora]|uniref:Pre-mRNA-processing factor 19 n=1 Tax=Entomortierella chlamydospora TaxID=101097 RepID=A0A9P6T4F7_9FUNG|nr:Pre-mRNA-processing factor 19 [Entomortierella chlamydospora]
MSGSKVVFVGNIPYEQTEEQLIEIFSEVGPVVSFRLVFERETGKPRGYGFCEFQDERTAASAVRNLNGREIGNRSLKVDYAETDPARNGGRDLEEGSFMRNIGPGSGPTGPPPSMPLLQQQQQPPPFMPLQGGPPRLDPRIANNPNVAPPPVNRPSMQQPPMGGAPPLAPPMAPGPSSADAISAVLATMTPQNVFDLISSMKVLGASEPDRAKAVLKENPQLSYALFQALLMMNLVEPSSLQRMFPAMPGPKAPAPNVPAPQQHLPPPQQHLPPPQQHLPPPPPQHMGIPPPHMQPPPHQFAPPAFPTMPPAAQPPVPQQSAPLAPSLEQQKALVAQVLALTPADIASLPEEQRANIIQLRAQLMGANVGKATNVENMSDCSAKKGAVVIFSVTKNIILSPHPPSALSRNMFCAISGEAPEQPVVSKKSGQVYERRLIVKYIEDNGKDPVSGEELSVEDLLDIKTSPGTVKPRPPTMTSIPSILSVLQNEWDSIMLETFTLKQQYQQVRQELSHALYQHDAACRVIARLMKERDAAREALANVQAHLGTKAPAAESSDVAMEDASGLSAEVLAKLDATMTALSKTRKRKPNVTAEAVQTYNQRKVFPGLHAARSPGITSLDLDAKNGLILTGGNDKNALIFSQSEEKVLATLKGHSKKITHVSWTGRSEVAGKDLALTASADHTVKIWSASGDNSYNYSAAHTLSGHTADVTGLCTHPCKDYVATASMDSSWAFHDLETGATLLTARSDDVTKGYTSAAFHPDGLLFGTGTADSTVKIWDVRTKEAAASFDGHTGAVKTMTFSENGYLMAAAGENNEVSIWNLRTMEVVQKLKVADQGVINTLAWDQSGTYLGVGGTDIRIFKVKTWQELANLTDNTAEITSLKFGPLGDYLVAGGLDRSIRVFGINE